MANLHRGEIEAVLDGKRYRLCLTLGALAELEAVFGEDDMLAVAERFEAGRITARDTIRILGAGLRGAGYDIDDQSVSVMKAQGGAGAYVEMVARLLTATFGMNEPGEINSDMNGDNGAVEEGAPPEPGKPSMMPQEKNATGAQSHHP